MKFNEIILVKQLFDQQHVNIYCYQVKTNKMSMNKEITMRPRSMSAKGPSNRSRPMSGITTTTVRLQTGALKTQLISNIYQSKQKSPKKKNSSKTLLYAGISTQQLAKFKKSINVTINKSREQLYEQNLQLKKQINKLSQELSILKGKNESKSKKVIQKNKQLDMQFQKQIFWNGSKTHLISGIKYQYEKIKKQYIQQTKQYNDLKVALLESKVPQYKIYSQAVQMENKRLVERLRKIMSAQDNALKRQQTDKQVTAALLKQYEQNVPLLEQKLTKLDTQLRNANESIKDKDKKMQFLQKLIIEKDNKEYHIGRKLKKTQKLKVELEEENQELRKLINKNEQQKKLQIKNIISEYQLKITKIQNKHSHEIIERSNRIRILEEENKSLENTLNKLRMSSSIVNTSHVNLPTNRSNTPHNPSTKGMIPQKNNKQQAHINRIENFDSVQSKNLSEQQKIEVPPPRTMQKADKKHSMESKKSRKIQFFQIQPIGQILKYRLINNNVDSIKMKQYFNNKEKVKQLKDQQWNDQYISMAEVEHILIAFPFNLEENAAFKLARYMIEDCHEEYVYTDPKNQNTRQIIKSIIKSVVGEYILFGQETKKNAKQFLDNYQTNLESALKTYYPLGKVPKKKFLDAINGLGVQVSESVAEYLLAEAFKKSKNLQQIEYNHLFIK